MGLSAGWYPQDDGGERFWDGSEWTDAVRVGEGRPPEAPVEAVPEPPEVKPGMSRSFLFWGGLAGVLVFIAAVQGCGGDDDSDGGSDINPFAVQNTCEDLVKNNLKNPSSAEFSEQDQGATFASGLVAGTNALGGTVTYSYRCTLDADGKTVRLAPLTPR
ncbi:MAG TPA: DUF2510 domain-containing protein [Vicinamibacteria bacterium]|nr:DUF2510 domain-containing protein [Vicinamibacteria bacterium]